MADYGVSQWNMKENRLDYFIGVRAEDAKGDTAGTMQIQIPGGLYAIFATPSDSHFNFVTTIHRTWQYILNIWIPQSDYRCAVGYEYQFETYIESSRMFSEEIYIPIEVKQC